MYIDVHCHLYDLKEYNQDFEDELKKSNICLISSSTNLEEFKYNEELANRINNEQKKIYLSFAIHPQLLTHCTAVPLREKIEFLYKLASEKRISAIGECGFDLYNDEYKATEKWQDEVFQEQLEIALKYDLPLILHVRRAMHKVFLHINKLKKCKSVIFHSWPGTLEEGQSLFKKGVNAYFSFGNTILHGHKQQIRSIINLPIEKILTETDSPYQPQKDKEFSSWADLSVIIEKISLLRNSSISEIESQIESNFNSSLRLCAVV